MFLQYYMLAFVKIALLIALPPYLLGLVAAWKGQRKAEKYAKFLAIGYVVLIELIVLVEKGAPFFFANLYFMFSLSPVVWLQYALGVGGLAMWLGFATRQANNGVLRYRALFTKGSRAA